MNQWPYLQSSNETFAFFVFPLFELILLLCHPGLAKMRTYGDGSGANLRLQNYLEPSFCIRVTKLLGPLIDKKTYIYELLTIQNAGYGGIAT